VTADRRRRPSTAASLPCDLRRRRHRLAAIPIIVAAGLGFAMHNNQSEVEAAQ
jgi:hypothetical protein